MDCLQTLSMLSSTEVLVKVLVLFSVLESLLNSKVTAMIMLVKDYLVGRLLCTHPETVDLFRRTIL
uniref:Uncharacterized protein n=1 Tax=Arundo donax TaxID=35708 RepID=A0A0A9FEN7_ARUDO